MKKTYIPLLAAGLLSVAPAAFAMNPNWYVGASVGRSNMKEGAGDVNDALGNDGYTALSSSTHDTRDTGYKVFLGYQFNPNFALEGGYANLGEMKFDSTVAAPTPGSLSGDIKTRRALFFDAVGTAPLGDNFSLFGKIGVYNAKTDLNASGSAGSVSSSGTHTGFHYGAGVGYAINKNLEARLEAEQFHRVGTSGTGTGNVNLYSVGLEYRFQ